MEASERVEGKMDGVAAMVAVVVGAVEASVVEEILFNSMLSPGIILY